MNVPMLDLRAQYAKIKPEVDEAVLSVLESQQFRGGPVTEEFETAVAEYLGEPVEAMGVASGTDALLLALKALELEPGDEVITTPFTFFATAGAIVNAGAKPVFADIDPVTFNLDPKAAEALITPRTRAIVAVHLYGQSADMAALQAIAGRRGLALVEDAAQALGARYQERPACTLGDVGCISFYPTKNLGAAGEGGMVVSANPRLAERVRLLRAHGGMQAYQHEIVGTNSHLHAMQAAILRVKLRYLDAWNEARRGHAAHYNERFASMPLVVPPEEAPGNHHVYHQYVIRIPRRDEARMLFQREGIGCGVFYPIPLHQQPCFASHGAASAECPQAERASEEVLALPIAPELSESQIDLVADTVAKHLGM